MVVFFLLFGSTGSDVEGEDDGEDDGLEYEEDEDDDEEGGHVSLSAVRNKSKLFKRAISISQKKFDRSHVYIWLAQRSYWVLFQFAITAMKPI